MHNERIKIIRAAQRQDYMEIEVILIKENANIENKSAEEITALTAASLMSD